MNEDNKLVTMEDLLNKGIKIKPKMLTKKEVLELFNVDEELLKDYADNQCVVYKDVLPKK